MRKGYVKRVLLCAWLIALGLLLGGCMNQISERGMADLSQKAIEPGVTAPQRDGAQDSSALFTLYFLAEDGVTLRPVTRRCTIAGGMTRAQAALEALLSGPGEGERGVMWPDLGISRSARLLEVSCGVATVRPFRVKGPSFNRKRKSLDIRISACPVSLAAFRV